eukprot:CAMPEP_0181252274 /NCGR_PEP_ID=MMETSP1096-20121128/47373_1 /TAXON_ID=156174 ORGANISM="Chrysochromulina ericina, Strain CCMP281" /NCGR_SAMPLE_ID=MMETSP1096 /ASSEMBLY_ACC=CAM_ASM_000453 /LENGTH=61 /DNA_ID=CAMNT_0023350013 /DNA_START=1 /DNA_END=186 /DNA_ORIENTATION=-
MPTVLAACGVSVVMASTTPLACQRFQQSQRHRSSAAARQVAATAVKGRSTLPRSLRPAPDA